MLNRLPGNRLQPPGKQRGEGNLFLHLGWLRPDRVRRLSIILIGLATVLCAQADDEEEPIEPEAAKLHRPVDFNRDIAPILEAGCIACHNKTIQESDLILEDVAGIVKGGVSGPAVLPGKPLESLLFLAAARKDEPFMPPMPNDVQAKPLTPKQLGLIRLWIQEGAKAGMGGTGREGNWKPIPSHLKAIYSVALSPWARFAAAGRTNRIAIYDLAAATQTTALHDPNLLSIKSDDEPMYGADAAHRDFVHSLAFGPSGRLLASGGYRTVKLWRRPTNIRRIQFDSGAPVTTIALSRRRRQYPIVERD